MEKSKAYLEARAKRRLKEIENKLNKYDSNRIIGNNFLKETIKILERERDELKIKFNTSSNYQADTLKQNFYVLSKPEKKEVKSENLKLKEFSTIESLEIIKEAISKFYDNVEKDNWKKAWNLFTKLTYLVNTSAHHNSHEYKEINIEYKNIKDKYFKTAPKTLQKSQKRLAKKIISQEKDIGKKYREINFLIESYKEKILEAENILLKLQNVNLNDKFIQNRINNLSNSFNVLLNRLTKIYNNMKPSIQFNDVSYDADIYKLKDEYNQIIDKLNSLNLKHTKNQKTEVFKISKSFDSKIKKVQFVWQDIKFGDGYISFFGWAGYRYQFKSSRAIFSTIKDSVTVPSATRFLVSFDPYNSTIIQVSGLEVLNDVFQILEVNNILFNYSLGDINYFKKNILGKLINEQIIKFFLNKTKREAEPYLDYLCHKQGESYRIIPVLENRKFEMSNSLISEYVFLFAFKGQSGKTYIIWESTIRSRATHIFCCTHEDYAYAAQKIFDYIYSIEITNKRQLLHISEFTYFKGRVNYVCSNNHDYIQDWMSRIRSTCY